MHLYDWILKNSQNLYEKLQYVVRKLPYVDSIPLQFLQRNLDRAQRVGNQLYPPAFCHRQQEYAEAKTGDTHGRYMHLAFCVEKFYAM